MLRHATLRVRTTLGIAVVAALVAMAGISTHVWGQADGDAPQSRPRVYPPTDRLLSRGMRRAEESVARGEYSQAITFLDEVLGRGEDFFTETGDAGGYSGLKESARRLIRELPPDGRRIYEASFGPVAERQLRAALESGSIAGVESVVERYFDTPAGYQAALVLAADHDDAGRHLASALLYQQLLDTPAAARLYDPELSVRAAASWLAADDANRAETLLADLAARNEKARVEIGGRDYSLAVQGAPLSWLRTAVGEPDGVGGEPEQQWLTYRGNAARNGETTGGLPHMRVRWKVRLMNHWKLEELFEDYSADLVRNGSYVPVASAPLAAGNYIAVRTPHGLLAVDFRNGKRIWRSEVQRDAELERLMKSGAGADADGSNADAARAFARRIWEDYLYGMTSSDGARVYAIRDLPLPMSQDYELSPMMMFGAGETRALSNRLSAYDLEREGALAWEIDGAATSGDLAGAFFLGAPLALGPSLYVLAEIRDDIYLAALNRETGALEWRQQLANLETGVQLDLRRRVQALMPSYDGGMLVCPTGAGLVVGVDLSKRSLAWAYQYESVPAVDAVYRAGPADPTAGRTGTWSDSTATIADGRVLISPRESKQLHCLDLHTGRMHWRREREAMKEIACVDDGVVLLADSTGLSAVKLEDGSPAWNDRRTPIPRDASPSGAGFLSGGRYFLPLTSGEVIAVTIADGRIVDRVASRDGSKLGNLICHRGTVISQNGMFLDCFDQVEALRKISEERIANNANDSESLRALGEIAYNEGRLSEAIELTERAYRIHPDDLATQETLGECLVTALDEDFAAHGSRLPLLKELERDGAVRRLDVLRIEAQGAFSSGDVAAAADACLALYSAGTPSDEMFELRGGHKALASRWAQAQLAAIWERSDQAQQKRIDERVGSLAPAEADIGDERWERYLEFFAALPAALPAKMALARKLDAADQGIESQQFLLDLVDAEDDAMAREATARLAAQLHRRGLSQLAREFDARLARDFADEICLEGKTGRELLTQWHADDEERTGETTIDWPTGRVEVREATTAAGTPPGARSRAPMWSVRLEHGDSILASGAGFLGGRGAELSWQDGYGRPFFQANIGPQSQSIYRQSGSIYGASRGNLLITSVGRELTAFNTLAGGASTNAALLWRAGLGSNFDYEESYLQDFSESPAARPGWYATPRLSLDDKWVGVIGPITSGGCVYQDQRGLTCVDPITGIVKWSRSDVPPGCDLFGDQTRLFVTPPGKLTARVYSMIDGREEREVKVPPWRELVTTRGRQVVRWRQWSNGRINLSSVDALSGKSAWRYRLDAGAKIRVDGDRYLAVVEPSGRARVIEVSSGKMLVDQELPAQPRLRDIHLLVSASEFVLLLEHSSGGNADRVVRPFGPGDSPVVDGDVVAFDRPSGSLRWSRPASVVRQALVLNLPPDLPFIAFAGTLRTRGAADGRESMSVLLLDKATGRTIYHDDALPQTGMGYCVAQVADLSRREITLDVSGRVMAVTYTDLRRPPEPPAMAEVESPGSARSGGILGILRATIGSE